MKFNNFKSYKPKDLSKKHINILTHNQINTNTNIKTNSYSLTNNTKNETRPHFIKVDLVAIPEIEAKDYLHHTRQNVHPTQRFIMAIKHLRFTCIL